MTTPPVAVEICVDDVGGAAAAARGGADRVELCAGLAEGGTTPTPGLVRHALRTSGLGVQVLVRARPGDFVFSGDELAVMVDDIERLRELTGAEAGRVGFTLGALTPEGLVNEAATARLVSACGDAPVTFHKAFDTVPDQPTALRRLVDLGVTRVLTSGRGGPATDNLEELARLVAAAGDPITVVAAGGVRPHNAALVVRSTGVREIHLRAARSTPSASLATSSYDAGRRDVTCADTVAAVVAAVAAVG